MKLPAQGDERWQAAEEIELLRTALEAARACFNRSGMPCVCGDVNLIVRRALVGAEIGEQPDNG